MDYSSAVGSTAPSSVPPVNTVPQQHVVKVPGLMYIFYAVIAIPALWLIIQMFRGNGGVLGTIAIAFILATVALYINKNIMKCGG